MARDATSMPFPRPASYQNSDTIEQANGSKNKLDASLKIESLISMNVIKEFYIEQYKQQMPAIEQAFRWRLDTMPKGERIGSVTFMIASLNAIIGSLCLAGVVFILNIEASKRCIDIPNTEDDFITSSCSCSLPSSKR